MNVEGCYFCQDETGSDDQHCGNIEDHDDDDVIMVTKKRKRKVS